MLRAKASVQKTQEKVCKSYFDIYKEYLVFERFYKVFLVDRQISIKVEYNINAYIPDFPFQGKLF